jgi:NAD(P)-dependent dehydrogenase (short-subunit alcohol dehydrogenase family)
VEVVERVDVAEPAGVARLVEAVGERAVHCLVNNAYRMGKTALNIAAVSLARDLAQQGVAVAIIHPGMVDTDMLASIGHRSDVQARDAARGIFARLDELTLETSGSFWHMNGEPLPW